MKELQLLIIPFPLIMLFMKIIFGSSICKNGDTDQLVYYSAGAVFNLICDDNDEVVMSKIEQYFDIQVPEVTSLAP